MKVFACNKLTPTLQTHLGMVLNNGKPAFRYLTQLPGDLLRSQNTYTSAKSAAQLSEAEVLLLFATCVVECRLPEFPECHPSQSRRAPWSYGDADRLKHNVHACCNLSIDLEIMKKMIVLLDRLDLEQAAAIVISAIRNDSSISNRMSIVSALIEELDYSLIRKSCMWLEYRESASRASIEQHKFSKVVDMLRLMVAKSDFAEKDTKFSDRDYRILNWADFLPILIRVRRCCPRTRGLFIPKWIFHAAGTAAPSEFAVWDKEGRVAPGHEPIITKYTHPEEIIVLSRKAFRAFQRRLLQYYRPWDPVIRLRKAITDFEASVQYSADHIRSKVLTSRDTLVVAHYFFAIQRRLQRKVVSDLDWTTFLAKGESGNVLQNNTDIPTTFEQRLSEMSGHAGVPVTGEILPQIDRCCLLMEEYVSIYGNGDYKNLIFVRGVRGGTGRGPVDEYNVLCRVLKTLCKAAKEQGLECPDPVRKFLAKDILAHNNSWEDDAFANGRVPGWETWLSQRREMGVIQGMEDLNLG